MGSKFKGELTRSLKRVRQIFLATSSVARGRATENATVVYPSAQAKDDTQATHTRIGQVFLRLPQKKGRGRTAPNNASSSDTLKAILVFSLLPG